MGAKIKQQARWSAIICGLGVLLGSTLPGAASAATGCTPVSGKFESQTLPPGECGPPVFFCTKGSLTGGLHADYEFVAQQFTPANEPSVPAAFFYSGFSAVHTRQGDLLLTDTGALDLMAWRIAALLTVTGGTGDYTDATGFVVVHGSADAAAGTNRGRYSGEVCVPPKKAVPNAT